MKARQEVPRPLALGVIAIVLIFMLLVIFAFPANAQVKKQTGKEYHQKLQKELSWENYRSNRLKNAKEYAKAVKQMAKDRRREEKLNEKIRRYYAVTQD